MNKIKELFSPTTEKEIERTRLLLKLHEEFIGDCSTCEHYVSPQPDLPEYVVDYGECSLKKDMFYKKVCGLCHAVCSGYQESTGEKERLKQKLYKLEGEHE